MAVRDDRQNAHDPEHLRATQERRRSGSHGAHDPRPNRRRSRGDAERFEIDESSNES